MADKMMPNTFITEDGQMIFIEEEEIPKDQLDCLIACDKLCRRVEKRYGTTDILGMMKAGAGRKEVVRYLDAKYSLMVWGYD